MTDTPRKFRPALTGASRLASGPGRRRTAHPDHVRGGGMVSLDPRGPIPPTWQRGRVHELARMKLIDLIALYQSMLPDATGEHDQVARTAPGGWTKDQVITAIRNLEAPYDEVGGWARAMRIIGACEPDLGQHVAGLQHRRVAPLQGRDAAGHAAGQGPLAGGHAGRVAVPGKDDLIRLEPADITVSRVFGAGT